LLASRQWATRPRLAAATAAAAVVAGLLVLFGRAAAAGPAGTVVGVALFAAANVAALAALAVRAAARARRSEAERRLADRSLRASERRFRAVVEACPAGLILVGRDGTIVLDNEPLRLAFGYAPGELIGAPAERLIPERLRDRRAPAFAAPAARAAGAGWETSGRHKDGSEFPVEVGLRPVETDDGPFLLASVVDIRARKRAEDALVQSEARFRQLADAMPQIVWAAGPDGRADYFNRRWYELTGADGPPAGEDGWLPVVHPDDRRRCLDDWAAAVRTGRPYQIEYRLRFPHAPADRWYLARALPVADGAGRVVRWYGTATDIDDQKRAEHQLRELNETLERRVAERTAALGESEGRLKMVLGNAQLGLWDWDVPAGRIHLDDRWHQMLGYTPGELPPRIEAWERTVHPDDLPGVAALLARHLAGDDAFYDAEYRGLTRAGGWVWVNARGRVQARGADGAAVRMVGTVQDVTRRKAAEAALAAGEALLRQFIAHAPAAIAMFDTDMRYLRVSARWLTDYRLSGQNLIGRSHDEVFPDRPARWKEVHRRVLAGAVEGCAEDPVLRADGTVEWLQWEAHPWRRPDGSIGGLIFFTQVVTARKRAEAALREGAAFSRGVLDSLSAHIAVVDRAGVVTAVNRAWERYARNAPPAAGVAARTGVGASYLGACDRGAAAGCADARAAAAGVRGVLAGGGRWFAMSVTPLGTAGGGAVVAHADVTARRRAEAALREKTQVLETVLDSMGDGVLVSDPTGAVILRNRAYRDLHDGPAAGGPVEGGARACGLYLPGGARPCPPDRAPMVRAMRGESVDDAELEVVSGAHPGGVAVSVTARPLAGPAGVAGGVVVVRDVSVRKRSEAALRRSEQRFRAIFHSQFQFIGLMTTDGTLVEANRAALAAVGVAEESVLNRPFWETPWWAHDPAQQAAARTGSRRPTRPRTGA
jgi:PAS domain S-box-containing protein